MFKRRLRFNKQQVALLESSFSKCQRPEKEELSKLTESLRVDAHKVIVWFRNRRVLFNRTEGQSKRGNNGISATQEMLLKESFDKFQYPDSVEIERLANLVGLSPKWIRKWFASKRYRLSKESHKVILLTFINLK
jgi:hypothetical protein